MILLALAPLALAGAAAGPAAGAAATTTTTAACSAWNGAQPVNPGLGFFSGVAVLSPCDVWAVGNTSQPLIEHWSGGSWATVPSPNSDSGALIGISATSASDIWAVGDTSSAGALILHYDGAGWTQQASPPAGRNGGLLTVDARTANDAWAAGFTGQPPTEHALMLRWDGTSWTPSSLPAAVSGDGIEILAVSADSATDAWAVANLPPGDASALLHWDGSQWTSAPVTDPAGALIRSVTALSPTNVWAVGHYMANGNEQTLVEHYDGASWNAVSSPNPGGAGRDNELVDVTATSGSDVWATGSYYTNPTHNAFALHWNGSSWAPVTLPLNAAQATDSNPQQISAAGGQAWVSGYAGFHTNGGLSPFAVPVPLVPDVSGDTVSAATSALTAAGLTVSSTQDTTTNCTPSVTGHNVVGTDPTAGQQAPVGQAVTLTVCSATVINPTVTVPDVTGEVDASARSDITSAGLHVGTITLKANCTVPRGTVLGQNPAGGTTAPFGSSVNLTEATRSGGASQQITPHACTQ
jgi:hypothetical protein